MTSVSAPVAAGSDISSFEHRLSAFDVRVRLSPVAVPTAPPFRKAQSRRGKECNGGLSFVEDEKGVSRAMIGKHQILGTHLSRVFQAATYKPE
jgi:hypothetical protein